MTRKRYKSVSDYKVTISGDNVATVLFRGREIWKSRAFRIRDQAERAAREYVDQDLGIERGKDGITLEVQDLSVDADIILGGL